MMGRREAAPRGSSYRPAASASRGSCRRLFSEGPGYLYRRTCRCVGSGAYQGQAQLQSDLSGPQGRRLDLPEIPSGPTGGRHVVVIKFCKLVTSDEKKRVFFLGDYKCKIGIGKHRLTTFAKHYSKKTHFFITEYDRNQENRYCRTRHPYGAL